LRLFGGVRQTRGLFDEAMRPGFEHLPDEDGVFVA
jgi:hypothetical protein